MKRAIALAATVAGITAGWTLLGRSSSAAPTQTADAGTGAPMATTPALAAPPLAATPQPPVSRVFPYPMTAATLPNGLSVVLVPYDSPGLVAYYTLVRVGSRNEVEPGHSGFAHLFEHMMFRGTKKHPAGQWEQQLRGRGVDSNAFTSNDQTVYTFILPTRALPTLVELEADRFQNLSYTEEVFKTETKAVFGEYQKNFSNPAEKLEEVLFDTAFDKHPYKHTTMGFLADIAAMPTRHDYGLQFFQRFYRPDNCTVFVLGDFEPRATLELLQKHYGTWSGKAEQQNVAAEPQQTAERRKHLDWDTPTKPRLMVGYKTPSLGTDLAAAAVQNILGPYLFGESSPLYRDLVLGRQLAEGVRSQYLDTREPRLFYFLATLKSEAALPEVEKSMALAITELAAGTVDQRRLDDVKSNLRYSMMMSLETPGQLAEALALSAAPTGDPQSLNALYDRIAATTAAELAAFAKKYLVARNRTTISLARRLPGTPAVPSPPAPKAVPK